MARKVHDGRLLPFRPALPDPDGLRFIDLFCGIGGFHAAAKSLGMTGVFACDIDEPCRAAYSHNYGLIPAGDIAAIPAEDIPDHELLCAGFPCQPFSIIGDRAGFADARGTLFFEILRILEAKRPPMVVLENVRQLVSHDGGKTIARILESLRGLGYWADYRILNALKFGLPQKRERVLIVALLSASVYGSHVSQSTLQSWLLPYGTKIRRAMFQAILSLVLLGQELLITIYWLMVNAALRLAKCCAYRDTMILSS